MGNITKIKKYVELFEKLDFTEKEKPDELEEALLNVKSTKGIIPEENYISYYNNFNSICVIPKSKFIQEILNSYFHIPVRGLKGINRVRDKMDCNEKGCSNYDMGYFCTITNLFKNSSSKYYNKIKITTAKNSPIIFENSDMFVFLAPIIADEEIF